MKAKKIVATDKEGVETDITFDIYYLCEQFHNGLNLSTKFKGMLMVAENDVYYESLACDEQED
jgi:hypothetical protein